MTSTLRRGEVEGGGKRGEGKSEMLSDVEGGWGVSECSGHPIFIFFIKENWICAMTRHHGEPNIIGKKFSF